MMQKNAALDNTQQQKFRAFGWPVKLSGMKSDWLESCLCIEMRLAASNCENIDLAKYLCFFGDKEKSSRILSVNTYPFNFISDEMLCNGCPHCGDSCLFARKFLLR